MGVQALGVPDPERTALLTPRGPSKHTRTAWQGPSDDSGRWEEPLTPTRERVRGVVLPGLGASPARSGAGKRKRTWGIPVQLLQPLWLFWSRPHLTPSVSSNGRGEFLCTGYTETSLQEGCSPALRTQWALQSGPGAFPAGGGAVNPRGLLGGLAEGWGGHWTGPQFLRMVS